MSTEEEQIQLAIEASKKDEEERLAVIEEEEAQIRIATNESLTDNMPMGVNFKFINDGELLIDAVVKININGEITEFKGTLRS